MVLRKKMEEKSIQTVFKKSHKAENLIASDVHPEDRVCWMFVMVEQALESPFPSVL